MRVMHLNPAVRLFRAQLTDVPILFIHFIGHDILYIVFQENF